MFTVLWQYPEDNWCDGNKSRDYSWATHLEFEARDEAGGEQVTIGVGNLEACDSTQSVRATVTFDKEKQMFSIPLSGHDLSKIVSGLVVEINEEANQSFLESNSCIRIYIEHPRFTNAPEQR